LSWLLGQKRQRCPHQNQDDEVRFHGSPPPILY
jgi:hypothetical protein